MNIETVMVTAGTILAIMPHVAAIIGTPAWLGKIGALQSIYNVLASRYGKDRPQK